MLNPQETRQYLKESEFENLFTQELGWDNHTQTLNITSRRNRISTHCNCPKTRDGRL